jgi:capreomycidine synthase
MTLADIRPAQLEDWLRERYFGARIDVSSSGVENYSLAELRRLLSIPVSELDSMVFRDSPSAGAEVLRTAVAARSGTGRPEDVMVTHGSTEGLWLALASVVRPGDEVVVQWPGYHSLTGIAEALGARLRIWRLRVEDDFAPDVAALARLVGPHTRAVVVNFPHNPTGGMPTPDGYAAILATVERYGCYLFWDGAFRDLVYDRPPLPDPAGRLSRCVSFGTLSKAYGLPGLRVGWCIAPREVRAGMVRLRDYVSISTSPLAEMLATHVLRNADVLLGPRLAQAAANRRLLMAWVAGHSDVLSGPAPAGGVCAFPAWTGVEDGTAICAELYDRHGVLVVPGSCFGHPGRVRIGFGGPSRELADGLRRITETVAGDGRRAVNRRLGPRRPESTSRRGTKMTQLADTTSVCETAADLAAVASLLEIADRLGVIHLLERDGAFTIEEVATAAQVPLDGASGYLEALLAASLVVPAGPPDTYRAAADFDDRRYEAGYLSWALNANRPFIEHAAEFMRSPGKARMRYLRDGRQVAVSSRWMGSYAFYPFALSTILDAKPRHAVDLGAGTGRLLIEILLALPDSTAVALDLDRGACVEAEKAGREAGVSDRLAVVERSIQSVAEDPSPVEGADVVHAGFVFHDLMPDEEDVADAVLRNCREALRPGGIMAITEAVPYVLNERERRFSTIVTYYHRQFMGRRLLDEDEWLEKLRAAGFSDVKCIHHRFPTGRLFVSVK